MGNSEVFFPSYTKDDISQILLDRSKKAFKKNIPYDILEYCAELSSSQQGDARRALDLLRVAGELCDGIRLQKRILMQQALDCKMTKSSKLLKIYHITR